MRLASIAVLVVSCCIIATAESRAVVEQLKCDLSNPYTSVLPLWFHKPLPGKMDQWSYDGISPFGIEPARVKGNDMSIPLVGRGNENPLEMVGASNSQRGSV